MCAIVLVSMFGTAVNTYGNKEVRDTNTISSEVNLVSNPGFENVNWDTGRPEHWTVYTYSGGDAQFSVDGDLYKSGNYAARIDGVKDAAQTRGAFRQVVPVDGGSIYQFSGWFQASDITDRKAVTARLVFRSSPSSSDTIALKDSGFEVLDLGADDYLVQASLFWIYPQSISEEDWAEVRASFKAPINATHVWIQLFQNDLDGNIGTVWWDDISITAVD